MLNSAPNEWTLASITKHVVKHECSTQTKNGWEPSRPYGLFSLKNRCRLAWAVFTGQADALFWPNQSPPKAY